MAHRPIPCRMPACRFRPKDAGRLGVVLRYDLAAWRNAQWEFRLWGSVVVLYPIATRIGQFVGFWNSPGSARSSSS